MLISACSRFSSSYSVCFNSSPRTFVTAPCVPVNIFTLRFRVYFSSKLNIVDACVVVITLVVTMIYTFSDLSGPSLIPR